MWQCDTRLAMRDYRDIVERDAFRAGYSDGFHDYPRQPGDWPNAYSAGYWEGHADAGIDRPNSKS